MNKRLDEELLAYDGVIAAFTMARAAHVAWRAVWEGVAEDEEPDDDAEIQMMIDCERRAEDAFTTWERIVCDGDLDEFVQKTVTMLDDVEGRMRRYDGDHRYARRFGLVIDAIDRAVHPTR